MTQRRNGERELLCAIVASGPLLRGDALVVLCGEDGERRADVALEMLRQQAAKMIVLSGGIDGLPRWHGAKRLEAKLIGAGIAPDRILVDIAAQNTRENATNVVQLAVENNWGRLLIVASPYHVPRAFLSFVQALKDVQQEEGIHVLMIPASQTKWFEAPEGMTATRSELLSGELSKIEEYRTTGHVASYADGLAYLRFWEAK